MLDHDPDLGEGLDAEGLARAKERAYASCFWRERGRWPTVDELDPTGSLGLLIMDGFATRELRSGSYTAAEMLGPGDVLQPWPSPDWAQRSVAIETRWTVVQRVRAASLDREFVSRVSPWPEILASISRRLTWHTTWLLFQLNLCALRRIDDRVLLMLWQFADRWGTMTPNGVTLNVPLTHDLLASLVGGRRPSVSAAVRRLVEQERISPLPRSRWLLLGGPPAEFHDDGRPAPR